MNWVLSVLSFNRFPVIHSPISFMHATTLDITIAAETAFPEQWIWISSAYECALKPCRCVMRSTSAVYNKKCDVSWWWRNNWISTDRKWCLSFSLKAGRTEIGERRHDSLLQISEATDENDLEFAIGVFHVGTHYWQGKKIEEIVSAHTVQE